jgi:hypothetical protein
LVGAAAFFPAVWAWGHAMDFVCATFDYVGGGEGWEVLKPEAGAPQSST